MPNQNNDFDEIEEFLAKLGTHAKKNEDPLASYLDEEAQDQADQALHKAQIAEAKSDKVARDFNKTQTKFKKITKEVAASRNKNLETLAIFVALFTFASLNFQMFANVDKAFWVPLSLVLLGGLMLFCGVISSISALSIDGWWRRVIAPVLCGLVATGLIGFGAYFYNKALDQRNLEEQRCNSIARKIAADPTKDGSIFQLMCSAK